MEQILVLNHLPIRAVLPLQRGTVGQETACYCFQQENGFPHVYFTSAVLKLPYWFCQWWRLLFKVSCRNSTTSLGNKTEPICLIFYLFFFAIKKSAFPFEEGHKRNFFRENISKCLFSFAENSAHIFVGLTFKYRFSYIFQNRLNIIKLV